MTSTYRVFKSATPEFLKIGCDQNAQVGVTHSVWHGFQLLARRNGQFPGCGCATNRSTTKEQLVALFQLPEHVPRTRFVPVAERADMYADIAILMPMADMWTTMGMPERTVPLVDQPPVPDPRLGGAEQERQQHQSYVSNRSSATRDPQRPTVLRQTQLLRISSWWASSAWNPQRSQNCTTSPGRAARIFCHRDGTLQIAPGWNNHEQRDAERCEGG
ncbi:MAG: hypothetical protein ACLR8Y_08805 [Alistipes indistinctus]